MPQLPVPGIIGLLAASNVFLTTSSHGHPKYEIAPLATIILISRGITSFEYYLQVPANRFSHGHSNAMQLKTIR